MENWQFLLMCNLLQLYTHTSQFAKETIDEGIKYASLAFCKNYLNTFLYCLRQLITEKCIF